MMQTSYILYFITNSKKLCGSKNSLDQLKFLCGQIPDVSHCLPSSGFVKIEALEMMQGSMIDVINSLEMVWRRPIGKLGWQCARPGGQHQGQCGVVPRLGVLCRLKGDALELKLV